MAIESMTGFSRTEVSTDGAARVVCEIRSVNGKSLDMRLRLPNGLDRLELPLRQMVQQKLARGNLQISVAADRPQASGPIVVDEQALAGIVDLAKRLHASHGLPMASAGEILSLRGVLDVSERQEEGTLDAPILSAVTSALDQLKLARAREGAALQLVLLGQIATIERLVAMAASDASRTPEAIRERLSAQVRLLMDSVQGFDEQRLSMEAALLATKADIREELDRLNGHISAARHLLNSEGPVGRKLDFLSQEFNREVNTLCSKSNAASITAIGLELKAVVDQFREQVQNLE